MSIIAKIKRSVESVTALELHNYDEATINELLYSKPLPCAFVALLRDTELLLDGNQNRERANLAIFFVDKTQFDFDSEENEQIIERMKTKANTWLRSVLKSSQLEVVGSVRTTRVYNEFDSILTGIAFNLTIEEKYGFNDCTDEEQTPNHILKVSESGLYEVSDYYWVEVEVSNLDIYEQNDYLCLEGFEIDENDNIIIAEK